MAMTVRADDGTEVTYGPGDVFLMEPGHDAWAVGDEPCVLFDTGMAPYAKPASYAVVGLASGSWEVDLRLVAYHWEPVARTAARNAARFSRHPSSPNVWHR